MQRKELSFSGQKIFIGIDVHKDSWRVATAPEVGVVKGHSQKPSAKELLDFLKKNYPDGEYHAVYESGFSGFSTYYALQEVGIDCIVIHAADVPTTQYEEAMKTDKVDAVKLVKSLKAGLLTGIYIHKRDDIDARAVVRLRKTIQKQLGGYKSRVKHLLHSNGVAFPERFSKPGTHWSKAFINWLKQEVSLLSSTRISLDLLIVQVEGIRHTLLSATRKVRELSRNERYSHDYELLTSIPGIGISVFISGSCSYKPQQRRQGLTWRKDIPRKQETRSADCGGFLDKHLPGQGAWLCIYQLQKENGTAGGDCEGGEKAVEHHLLRA